MTKIDFYQISDEEMPFACRLIDQVYRRGHHIYVHTVGQEQARALDDHLWVFREDTFIPHALQETGIDAPIKIGCDHEPFEHQDVLINLSSVVPHFFSRFDRVAEVVPVDENRRQASRDSYSFYKQRGYTLNYHQMN